MKKIAKYAFILLTLSCGVTANAQMTFTATDVTKVNNDVNRWQYGTVTCTSQNAITSIIISMYNNEIASSNSGITPTRVIKSDGKNPETHLYLFSPSLTTTEVENYIKGIIFRRTNTIQGSNYIVNISVDANPTHLPEGGSTITAWSEHPDGSPHYYLWVPVNAITFHAAYNAAKTYYFQGMRGYLPTITSDAENKVLINISNKEGWSGGARTRDNIADTRNPIGRPTINNQTARDRNYRWVCGPETDIVYYNGPLHSSPGAGPPNGNFSGWRDGEPNGAAAHGGENCMQMNQPFDNNVWWNDYSPVHPNIVGYFIEFGGNGESYSVGGTIYPANPKYTRPTVAITNDQWHLFAPGNEGHDETEIKRAPLYFKALVVE